MSLTGSAWPKVRQLPEHRSGSIFRSFSLRNSRICVQRSKNCPRFGTLSLRIFLPLAQNRRQRAVQTGTDRSQQFGFGDGHFAVVTHCFADCLKQAFATRGVRPCKYSQAAVEHGNCLQGLVPVFCIAGPLAELSGTGTEGTCTSLRRRMTVPRNGPQQVDRRAATSSAGSSPACYTAGSVSASGSAYPHTSGTAALSACEQTG